MYSLYSDENVSNHNQNSEQNTNCTHSLLSWIRNHHQVSLKSSVDVPSRPSDLLPPNDRTSCLHQFTPTPQKLKRRSLHRKRHVRPNCCTYRAWAPFEWIGNRWRITYYRDGNHNSNNNNQAKPTTKYRRPINTKPKLQKN